MHYYGHTSLNWVYPEPGWPRLVSAVGDQWGWNKRIFLVARQLAHAPHVLAACLDELFQPLLFLSQCRNLIRKDLPLAEAPLFLQQTTAPARESNEHGGSAFTRSCFSYLMRGRRVLLLMLVFKKTHTESYINIPKRLLCQNQIWDKNFYYTALTDNNPSHLKDNVLKVLLKTF